MKRSDIIALLGVVALVTLAATAAVATAQTRVTLDDNHALASETKQVQFAQDGVARANIAAPNMTLTVATEHEQCNIDGYYSDTRNDYLCIDYSEEIERTIRIHIPDEYWSPYVRESVSPVAGDSPATFERIEGGQYQSVTVTVDEPGTYAWRINGEASYWAGSKDRTLRYVENATGVGAPQTDEWSYISPKELSGNSSTYVVRAPNGTEALVMEYKEPDGSWSSVPDEEVSWAPVYYQAPDTTDGQVYVFAAEENPPEVRYKTDASSVDGVGAAIREVSSVGTRLEDILGTDIPLVGN